MQAPNPFGVVDDEGEDDDDDMFDEEAVPAPGAPVCSTLHYLSPLAVA